MSNPVEIANKAVSDKAFKLLVMKKEDRPKSLFAKLPKSEPAFTPLHRQQWFRNMVDRISLGQRIYEGRAKHLDLYEGENVLCDHQHCKHREGLHSSNVPAGSGHRSKKDLYIFLKNSKKGDRISILG